MKLPSKSLIQRLSSISNGPCISVYMPTHRMHPANAQDPIRFQNLLKELESSLSQKYAPGEIKTYLQPFENIKDDQDIWNYNLDGLAIFSSNDIFEWVRLPLAVTELVVVADSFHTKPIRKYLQTDDRFQILGLNLHEIRMYEGNRHGVSEIELNNAIPKTIQDALGEELTDKHMTVAAYGGVGGESGNMYHGHGSKKDEVDIDAERFFRVVANAVHEHVSKESGLPLVLAALPEHHHLFKKVNKNPHLLDSGIQVNHDALPADKLARMAWQVMEPEYDRRLKSRLEEAGQAIADQKGSDLISDIVAAATQGRVETLLIEADLIMPGKIVDELTGRVEMNELSDPETDDLLDDIGEIVEQMGGKVLVVPANRMTFESGAVAIYRY